MAASSRSEELLALARFKDEVAKATGGGGELTVRDACEAWLENAAPRLSPNTLREFRGSLYRYVYRSPLADRRLGQVRARDLDAFYKRLLEA